MTSNHHNNIYDVPAHHEALLELFTNRYLPLCKEMDGDCQEDLFAIAPLLFGKWYHAALIENTLLSPANMFLLELPKTDCGHFAYTLHPQVGETPFRFALNSYSTTKHPFVDDLRILTDFCNPACEMDEHLFFLETDRKQLLGQLSQQSEFYLEYLTRIGWWLGLFAILPSIHVKKIQQSAYCTIFWEKSIEEILKEIANSACELAAERFSFSMDLENGVAKSKFFYNCLANPQETDRIFVDFYQQVDVNIEGIWKQNPAELSEEDRAIVSSCLFTGIMLDKWFFYPMSQFLQFLSPISFMSMKYFYLVNNLAALITMNRNIGAEIFSPPNYYTQTSLGKILFPSETKPERKFTFPSQGNFMDLLEAVSAENKKMKFAEEFYASRTAQVLALRITMKETPEFWKIIEMPNDISLDEFCLDIFSAFHLEGFGDYILSALDENDFPIWYSTEKSKKSIHKIENRKLEDLHYTVGQTFTLLPFPDTKLTLTIEVLEEKAGQPFVLYPRVSAQSNTFTEEEQIDELF